MICKLQRPLNDPGAPWLLYDRRDTISMMIPPGLITDFIKQKMGRDAKAFWECRVIDDEVSFIRRVADQNW